MSQSTPELVLQLVDRHLRPLVLYARQWCRVPEDVVQEAFVRLIREPKPPENVRAWLYRVVRNGAINAAPSAQRRSRHEAGAASRGEPWFCPATVEPLEAAEVTAALEELPLEQREVIIARLWGGLSLEEIGGLVDASIATVHRRYQAGIAVLRERFGETCPTNKSPID